MSNIFKCQSAQKLQLSMESKTDHLLIMKKPEKDLTVLDATTFLPVADPNAPNVQVTRMTLLCEAAPNPLVLDLTGE